MTKQFASVVEFQKNSIVLTGGGTAGHVTPNIALIDILKENDWQISYIGSKDGVEKSMIEGKKIPYYAVRSGKLRRYFSWQNLIDPFNLLIGIFQATTLLRKIKPQIIFSKGGFVSLPVVVAGYLNKIPVVIHESDMSPGLANKLSFPFAKKICTNFSVTKQHIKDKSKVAVVGSPIREELFSGVKENGLAIAGFNANKPCLLVMGGGQGSVTINNAVRGSLEAICSKYQIIHLCGKGKLDESLIGHDSYFQLEYADREIADLFAASDLIISRSGANTLCEILALHKPHVFIPLSGRVSRGDQIQNAKHFASEGISIVLDEENLNSATLLESISQCELNSKTAKKKMEKLDLGSASISILNILQDGAKRLLSSTLPLS
ncbi:MAG: undecaprenyldiphospho-muramoylpentapeptide beta-N-acetylglucosaminyltransferase [Legionellales bacterium RIFCSPHIGHO2_12_FULL_35_11]|nr:MAG: undecaprenyldiphospho-muramoylpentapeptide beta-N-acetylglucosaminyltransferase [Legionellales bacterium RIFCSPHIGHO2_12_FULL_35_11]